MNPFRQFASREDSRFRRRKFSPDQDAQQAVGQDANYQQNDPKGDCSDGGRNQPRNLRRVWIERDEREHQQAAGKQQSSGDLDRAATWAVAIILGIAAIAIGEPDIRCARLDSNQ